MSTETRWEPLGNPDGVTDFDEDVLLELVGGHAALIPVSARRLPPEVKLQLTDLMRLTAEIDRAVQELGERVLELRESGASWSVIGWGLGTTGEGARKRFGS